VLSLFLSTGVSFFVLIVCLVRAHLQLTEDRPLLLPLVLLQCVAVTQTCFSRHINSATETGSDGSSEEDVDTESSSTTTI